MKMENDKDDLEELLFGSPPDDELVCEQCWLEYSQDLSGCPWCSGQQAKSSHALTQARQLRDKLGWKNCCPRARRFYTRLQYEYRRRPRSLVRIFRELRAVNATLQIFFQFVCDQPRRDLELHLKTFCLSRKRRKRVFVPIATCDVPLAHKGFQVVLLPQEKDSCDEDDLVQLLRFYTGFSERRCEHLISDLFESTGGVTVIAKSERFSDADRLCAELYNIGVEAYVI